MNKLVIPKSKNSNLSLTNSIQKNDWNYSCLTDNLTGLANREFFLQRLIRANELATPKPKYSFAVLIIDIDRFKNINNRFGCQVGDELLRVVARQLEKCLDSQDTLARLGNDEFAILAENIENGDRPLHIAERVLKELALPFNLDGHQILAKASIGIAASNSNYDRPEELLLRADTAMCQVKKTGKAGYQIFDDRMYVRTMKLLQIENDLQRAIESRAFHLHYQPIVSLQPKRIVGFEALLRWEHPEFGPISPADFIPIAEETGAIVPLGWWVLHEACRQTKEWQSRSNLSDLTISVNISGVQLLQTDFVERVKQTLRETALDPRSLKLELTESVLIENTQPINDILRELQAIGVQFSLDDFGTGYSSLSYLHQFSFNTLKIDRSFIKSMETSAENLGIVKAIVALAEILGMKVVAEGIEKSNQLARLKLLKCQYGQGYLFSKGLDHKAAEALLKPEFSSEKSEQILKERSIMGIKKSGKKFKKSNKIESFWRAC